MARQKLKRRMKHHPLGNDYLAGIGRQWEESTKAVESMGLVRAIIRTGVVLDLKEGASPNDPFAFPAIRRWKAGHRQAVVLLDPPG